MSGQTRKVFSSDELGGLILKQKIPAVSVVIPMYNAEKYIAPCLESIFAQTFRDFEVIVVDHCSTDGSREIVEEYALKFKKFTGGGAELRLIKLKINVGNPHAPRNMGLSLSRGKYVYFMDADDLLMNNALECFHVFAEANDADVVITPNWYDWDKDTEQPAPKEVQWQSYYKQHLQSPELEPENLDVRVVDFMQGKFVYEPWTKFSRRDFLLENDAYFPKVRYDEDTLWTIKLACCARRVVFIPQALYIHRKASGSIMRNLSDEENAFRTRIFDSVKFLRGIREEYEFFQQNPQYYHALVNHRIMWFFQKLSKLYAQSPQEDLYAAICRNHKKELGECTELVASLCSFINEQQKQLVLMNEQLAALANELYQK